MEFFWQEGDGQIYPTLAKLLKEKSITIVADKTIGADKSDEGRLRKVYRITAKGLK